MVVSVVELKNQSNRGRGEFVVESKQSAPEKRERERERERVQKENKANKQTRLLSILSIGLSVRLSVCLSVLFVCLFCVSESMVVYESARTETWPGLWDAESNEAHEEHSAATPRPIKVSSSATQNKQTNKINHEPTNRKTKSKQNGTIAAARCCCCCCCWAGLGREYDHWVVRHEKNQKIGAKGSSPAVLERGCLDPRLA